MKKFNFHIAQVSFIKPILNELEISGCNLEKIYRSTGLQNYNLDNSENYIPVPILYDVLNNICKQEGINNIASTFYEMLRVTSLASWGNMIVYAPTVLDACKLAKKYGNTILTNETIGLEVNGPVSIYWQDFSGPFHKGGMEQMEIIALTLALNGFRIACGEDWQPIELHFKSGEIKSLDRILSVGSNTRVLFNQTHSGIVFPTKLFNLPMILNENSTINEFIPINYSSLSTKLNKLFDSNNHVSFPSIDSISEQFNVSSRTIQRHLAIENNSYEKIIDQWRFTNSLKFVEDPKIKISEIAHHLKYTNASNFIRAFKRWTGLTPARYREISVKMS